MAAEDSAGVAANAATQTLDSIASAVSANNALRQVVLLYACNWRVLLSVCLTML